MTTETPDDITERLRWESRLSRNGGVLFLPVLLDKAADEIEALRAQVAQYRDPQTIITLALAYAATRAHDGHLEPAPILGSSHFWGDFWGHLP